MQTQGEFCVAQKYEITKENIILFMVIIALQLLRPGTCYKKFNLHLRGADGHVLVLHTSVFEDDPWQLFPPFWACCLTCLVAFRCPEPQVFEHLPHDDQLDHWQSTRNIKSEIKHLHIHAKFQIIFSLNASFEFLIFLTWCWWSLCAWDINSI